MKGPYRTVEEIETKIGHLENFSEYCDRRRVRLIESNFELPPEETKRLDELAEYYDQQRIDAIKEALYLEQILLAKKKEGV